MKLKQIRQMLCLPLLLASFSCSNLQQDPVMDLSGRWTVQLQDADTTCEVTLPGSLAQNGVGRAVTDSAVGMLSEGYTYTGKAAYVRRVDIPQEWGGQPLELFLERTKVSALYVNDSLAGTCRSVSTPHVYVLPAGLPAGTNELRIEVDNTKSLLPLGGSHAYSEHTQTNWNGILGRMSLRRLDPVDIRQLRVDADTGGQCRLTLHLLNLTAASRACTFRVSVTDEDGRTCLQTDFQAEVTPGTSQAGLDFALPADDLRPWDEYTPSLYTLQVETPEGSRHTATFGIRHFQSHQGRLLNNGRTVFLRGKHEGGVFPLTGYPFMEKAEWAQYFQTVKAYGINHVRFHSWTPPEAAFAAADEAGIFLQTELPLWGGYAATDTTLIDYMKAEGRRILDAYGNHPSFVMMSLGNELHGDTLVMQSVVESMRRYDGRHLYATGTNNFYWDPHPRVADDFFVAMRHGREAADAHTDLRGSFSFADSDGGGIVNACPPDTRRNFAAALSGIGVPVLGHETGQYQVFPDFKEMALYTGVLRPLNFAVIQERLRKAGLDSQAEDFLKASGALSALCYREDIEMALRTPGFDGFQLLDLEDYPGQGTALVGILNAFMQSKGIIASEQWREFCNDVVPLARFSKYCWTTGETFEADVEVAHYGRADLPAQQVTCVLLADGQELARQTYTADLKQGQLNTVGRFSAPLSAVDRNRKLTLSVSLDGTDYCNSWPLWAYRTDPAEDIREGQIGRVRVTRDARVLQADVPAGQRVLYIPRHQDIAGQSVEGLFITDFWNYGMFRQTAINMKRKPSPGTFGLLTDPAHRLFSQFPTESHTNWQWWNLVKHSRPMILDDAPDDFRPLVQVIDNWDRNHRLGLIFEWPGSDGRILVCAADLFACKDSPEARALFGSMLHYLQEAD